MRVAQEEIFGPVLTVLSFDDEEEALQIANHVAYGLAGYLWTNDLTRALRFSDEMEAGMIWVNSENVRHLPTPFGGVKASGIGRDGGHWSFDFYMEQKNVAIATGLVGRYVADCDARILDAGCGTGNMAQVLHQMGYRNIEGLDASAGMLEIAGKKEIYQQLHQLYLNQHIDLPRDRYDAVVAAGVMTHGHAPPAALDGILEIARKDAPIVFSLSLIAFEEHGFKQKIEALEASGAWQKLDQSLLFRTYPFSEQEAHLRHWVLAYRKR